MESDVHDVHGHGRRVRRLRDLHRAGPVSTRTASSSSSRPTSAGRKARHAPRRTRRRCSRRTTSRSPTSRIARSPNDVAGDAWGVSFYDYNRWRYIRQNSNTGLFPEFMKAENDLLAAEGYIRTGNIAAAAAKIDLTRVANGGLPAVTGVVTNGNASGAGRRAVRPAGAAARRDDGRVRQHLRGDEVREAHRDDLLQLRPLLDRRPRLGRSRRPARRSSSRSRIKRCRRASSRSTCSAPALAARPRRECTDSDA